MHTAAHRINTTAENNLRMCSLRLTGSSKAGWTDFGGNDGRRPVIFGGDGRFHPEDREMANTRRGGAMSSDSHFDYRTVTGAIVIKYSSYSMSRDSWGRIAPQKNMRWQNRTAESPANSDLTIAIRPNRSVSPRTRTSPRFVITDTSTSGIGMAVFAAFTTVTTTNPGL